MIYEIRLTDRYGQLFYTTTRPDPGSAVRAADSEIPMLEDGQTLTVTALDLEEGRNG